MDNLHTGLLLALLVISAASLLLIGVFGGLSLWYLRRQDTHMTVTEQLLKELTNSLVHAVLGREDSVQREARYHEMVQTLQGRLLDALTPKPEIPPGFHVATPEELARLRDGLKQEAQEEPYDLSSPDPDIRPPLSRGFMDRMRNRVKGPRDLEGPVMPTPTSAAPEAASE